LCKITPHERGRDFIQYVVRLPVGTSPRSGFVQPGAQQGRRNSGRASSVNHSRRRLLTLRWAS
jgi:hypothetical protein